MFAEPRIRPAVEALEVGTHPIVGCLRVQIKALYVNCVVSVPGRRTRVVVI
jgi:hypothetical protein